MRALSQCHAISQLQQCSRCTPSLEFQGFLQALRYNCLTMRESTLVSIHETVVTVYMRAFSRCHAISQLQQVSLGMEKKEKCGAYPIWRRFPWDLQILLLALAK
ncbi:hypothetical protein CFP56_009730 [Quercus suber]|uniref:Uncharacterized protein n=1 Tax=Quercus suber TaxID=58331 RepID=A0AAW0L3A4_QUESU